jgi:hypothetical protein
MKNILKQILSSIFSCMGASETHEIKNNNSNDIASHNTSPCASESSSFYNSPPLYPLDEYSRTENINMGTFNKKNINVSEDLSITNVESSADLIKIDRYYMFLTNKPLEYKIMLDGFIKAHGSDSLKVKELILPECDISDRIYNIHILTGSQIDLNTYMKKFPNSLCKLINKENQYWRN